MYCGTVIETASCALHHQQAGSHALHNRPAGSHTLHNQPAGKMFIYLTSWLQDIYTSCKAAFWTQEISPRLSDVKHSLQSVFAIGSALTYLHFFWNVPLLHSSTRPGTSLHVISFTRPSPTLVLQTTNTGARRPGSRLKETHTRHHSVHV